MPKLPKYTSPILTRAIKNQLAPYTEFADAFVAGKPGDLQAVLERQSATFSGDRNLGLVKQCIFACMRRSIRTLTETYLTLSLPHIAELVRAHSSRRVALTSQSLHVADLGVHPLRVCR